MWYVLRFLSEGALQGIIVSEGSTDDEAIANATSRMSTPAGEVFGLPYHGEPPPELRYRLITMNDTDELQALMSNAAMAQMRSQWFWIRFVEEGTGAETGVALSDGATLPDALQRLATKTVLPPGEPEAYPYPSEPPKDLRYRILLPHEVQQLSGGFAPAGVGGWVNTVLNKVQEHDMSALPNANILQKMMERIERFRGNSKRGR